MRFPELAFGLPDWVGEFLPEPDLVFPTVEDRMRFVIELARLNIDYGTGGPFGAGIFEQETGRLLAPGVNLVETATCSVAHAEIVSIMIAQKMVGAYDLGSEQMPAYELVTTTEPCAMCLGAIPWSGVRRLTCGARDEDARSIGFDEGAKPSDWVQSLKDRGIVVLQDVLRSEARAVLLQYLESGGLIYNARRA